MHFGEADMLKNNIIALVLFTLLIGCASTKAPSGWHESPTDVDFHAWGAWLQLKVIPDKATSINDYEDKYVRDDLKIGGGEFISFQDSLVYLLNNDKLVKIPFQRIYRAEIEISDNKKTWLALWSLLGFASTMSHGWFLGISAPVWLIWGSVATVGESNRNRFITDEQDYKWWVKSRKFARFPQGLPPDFDFSILKSKRVLND